MGTKIFKFAITTYLVLLASCSPNSDDIFARHCKVVVLASDVAGYQIFELKMKEVQRYVPTDHPDVLVIEVKYSYRKRRGQYQPPSLNDPTRKAQRCGYSIGDSVHRELNDLELVYFAFDVTQNGDFDDFPREIINKQVAEWLAAHPQE